LGGANPDPVAPADMNRILGRVDELQDSGEEIVFHFVGETVKVLTDHLADSVVSLKK
jgi:hypothetical protein